MIVATSLARTCDRFADLSVGLERCVSVCDCLRSFTCCEQLPSYSCETFTVCGPGRTVKKQLTISVPPNVLVVHLMRGRGWRNKRLVSCNEEPGVSGSLGIRERRASGAHTQSACQSVRSAICSYDCRSPTRGLATSGSTKPRGARFSSPSLSCSVGSKLLLLN